ncbi:MAG: nicotinate-nucleotide adenylyltransferase [Odoribacter sp.]|nr:nicotinate-nucleotide adenylyltransferase [Odoribacter sp.]
MVSLFFGSFNPIHNGHIQIAEYVLQHHYCKEVWFVVSPQNPLKKNSNLLDGKKRLEIVEKALSIHKDMYACDIEFYLPIPSYTIDTLTKLTSLYPDKEFALIIGEDNLESFHFWKEAETICKNYKIMVYPRPNVNLESSSYQNIIMLHTPLNSISSTEIRKKIKEGKDISNDVPPNVLDCIVKYYKTDDK